MTILVVFSLFAQDGSAEPVQDTTPLPFTKLAPRLYKIDVDGTAVLASIGPDGVLLSDSGEESTAPRLLATLDYLGAQKIDMIVNTHWHADHTGGNLIFGEDALIIAHENVRMRLSEDKVLPYWEEVHPAFPPHALPDTIFSKTMRLRYNEEEIELIHFPSGHTDGDVAVWFKNANVLHVGDMVFTNGFPSIDFETGGSVEGFTEHIHTIAETMPPDIRIVAGHGPDFSIQELRDYETMMRSSIRLVQDAIRKGMSLETMIKEGLLDRWESYAGGYMSCGEWTDHLFHILMHDPSGEQNQEGKRNRFEAYVFSDDTWEIREISDRELESAVQIYFLGGCGYLISGGGKNILVDALYKHPNPRFSHVRTPDEAYVKMLNAEPPFENIDLLLVSHNHADHFTTDMGFPFLAAHPETRMIANGPTVTLASEDDPEGYEKVKHQIISRTPLWGALQELNVNGCSLKLYLVKHTSDDHMEPEYIVTQFLIEIGGLKILHMGDMYLPPNMETFRKLDLKRENIDIVFDINWNTAQGKILMDKLIQPKFFVVMHNRFEDEGRHYRSILESYPNTTIFLKPMERKVFLKTAE